MQRSVASVDHVSATAAGVTLVLGTAANLSTSISLTASDWDVSRNVTFARPAQHPVALGASCESSTSGRLGRWARSGWVLLYGGARRSLAAGCMTHSLYSDDNGSPILVAVGFHRMAGMTAGRFVALWVGNTHGSIATCDIRGILTSPPVRLFWLFKFLSFGDWHCGR